MGTNQEKHVRYIYDPQLTDPRIEELHPHSAFDFEQERWVTPICLLAKDAYFSDNSWNGGFGFFNHFL